MFTVNLATVGDGRTRTNLDRRRDQSSTRIWREESIQRELLGAVRNVMPYRCIAEALGSKGYIRTYQQCREMIKGLKNK